MIRVVYTGTRRADDVRGLIIDHLPMLERVALPLPDDLSVRLRGDGGHADRRAVFYSRNAAKVVFDQLTPEDFDGVQVWAVGARSAEWLADRLGRDVRSPERQDFEGLVSELSDAVSTDTLLFSFELAGTERRLDRRGLPAEVLSIPVYETVACNWDDLDGLLRRIEPAWVVFASPRGWESFRDNLHHRPVGDAYRVAVIGPNTRDAIVEQGGRVDLVAATPDLEELLREIAAG
jgi:uroporphyrinogen-III synthase